MKPWVQTSLNTFEFTSEECAHVTIQGIPHPFLSKLILFQVVELQTLSVSIPDDLISEFVGHEGMIEALFPEPPPEEIHTPEISERRITGIPFIWDLQVGIDFQAPPSDIDLNNLRLEKTVLINRVDFLNLVCSYHRSLYPDFETAEPLIRLTCKYAAFGLSGVLDIREREVLDKFWTLEPNDEEILDSWNKSKATPFSLEDRKTLPFHYLYGDYLKNKERSPYFEEVVKGARTMFYAWQMFMVLTCYRFLLSCTFASFFNPQFQFQQPKISNLIESPEVESVWNLYLSDPNLGFLFDSSISLDFDAYADNESLFTKIFDTYGTERLRQLWTNRLGERLPSGASMGSMNPKKTMTDIFDRNLEIHRSKDFRAFLDDPDFGFYWCARYNISSKIRHIFRRGMMDHMRQVGGISL